MLDRLHDFAVIFISILLQSLPFILVGVFASALVHLYLSERVVGRWLPRGRLPVVVTSSLLGLVVPVCDCGAIPLGRRLVAKGVPLYGAVTFMLAAPVVNPVVALSTAVAFQGDWRIVGLRWLMTWVVAVTLGLLASWLIPARRLPLAAADLPPLSGGSGATPAIAPADRPRSLRALLAHANDEFFDVIFYIVLGAIFTAAVQAFVPRAMLMGLGGDRLGSILALMPLATMLSICSEADAFVARALAGSFTVGAVLAFMVIGQVVDLRNGVLLVRTLGARYVTLVVVGSYLLTVVMAFLVNLVWPRL